ncbi:hypothetical protein ACFCYL_39490, partial [Streptomyces sp. NPDC056305]
MGQPESRENRASEQSELPPGQRLQRGWPVTHYGPVPKFKPDRWEFRVFGATADGDLAVVLADRRLVEGPPDGARRAGTGTP